jgi:Xaa-Pro aminopeptidase
MFQEFTATTRPEDGPDRLAALRAHLAREGLSGCLVPRADRHQGEYVAACDERLAWLTGFTGSAGFCAVLPDAAGVFVDGRYRVQVKAQVAVDHFTPVDWPEVKLEDWLAETVTGGGVIGYDPWLQTSAPSTTPLMQSGRIARPRRMRLRAPTLWPMPGRPRARSARRSRVP